MEISAVNAILNLSPRQPNESFPRLGTEQADAAREIPASQSGQRGEVEGLEGSVGELLLALAQRIGEGNEGDIDLSLSISIIRANLGSQIADLFSQENQLLGDLLAGGTSSSSSEADTNLRQRLFADLALQGLEDGALFNSSGLIENGFNTSATTSSAQIDTRTLLYGLLVGELGTSRDEAIEVLQALRQNPFEAFA